MTCATATADLAPSRRFGALPRGTAFYLLASITVSFLAGSSAPTPLYPLYQAAWGFSPITVTLVFGIYALALLGALLVAGRLSDHIGRRPVLIAATAAQAATMLLFAAAHSVSGLLCARILQGLSTGVAIAAVGAGMLDLDRTRGALLNSVSPPLGTAVGGLAAGLMVRYLPAPTHLVYIVLAAVFVLQGAGVLLMAESNSPRPGALASLKPQFGLPRATRGAMLLATPVLVAAWALAGFYASLGPGLLHRVFGLDSSLLGGLALFVLAGSGGTSVIVLRRQLPRRTMVFGAAALLAGVAVLIAGLSRASVAWTFVGTAIAGAGFGAGFQGALRSVVALAAPRESAGVLSVLFVVSYLAMGVPAVAAGWIVGQSGNILATAQQFGAAVMLLAALALWGALRSTGGAPATMAGRALARRSRHATRSSRGKAPSYCRATGEAVWSDDLDPRHPNEDPPRPSPARQFIVAIASSIGGPFPHCADSRLREPPDHPGRIAQPPAETTASPMACAGAMGSARRYFIDFDEGR